MSTYSLEEQLEILKKNFNNYSVILSVFLVNIAPNSSFRIYKPYIEHLASENSNKIIDTFILSVLKYENEIMNENESFFIGNSFDNDLDYDDEKRLKVFEFKSIWTSLSDENKDVIKSYMKLLCRIARKYFNLVYDNRNKY